MQTDVLDEARPTGPLPPKAGPEQLSVSLPRLEAATLGIEGPDLFTLLPPLAAARAQTVEWALLHWLPQSKLYLQSIARRQFPPRALADAFARFFAVCGPLIREFADTIGMGAKDIEDCAQDVWSSLLTALPDFHHDPGRGKFTSWLYAIVRNKAARWLREERPRTRPIGPRALAVTAPAQLDPLLELEHEAVEHDLLVRAIAQFKSSVGNDNYQVLYLRLIQQFSISDTASAMGKSAEWVRVHCCRSAPVLKRMVDRLRRERECPAARPA